MSVAPEPASNPINDLVTAAMSSQEDKARLHEYVRALAGEIRASMDDLKAIGAGRIRAEDIPTATDELDAIIQTTEVATGDILDAAEKIENISNDLAGAAHGDALAEAVTQIYQACNFQDLTGQRVKKIIDTLRLIDERVASICVTFGLDDEKANAESSGEPSVFTKASSNKSDTGGKLVLSDEDLLNGPALPGNAMSQEDIDRMLADF